LPETRVLVNPATGAEVARVALSGVQDMDAAVRAARAALPELELGAVWVNDHLPSAGEAPHDGFRPA
jgi:hypothetical protein